MSKNKRKPNWLLRGLIGISLGIHLVLFIHLAGIYRSNALTCIELTLKEFSKPSLRNIPRPRLRPKTSLRPRDVKKLNVGKKITPSLRPVKVDPSETKIPESLVERVSMPDIPDDTVLKFAEWDPGPQTDTSDYITSNNYLEMVRLRIESHKKYPDTARLRQIEGQTIIRFTISLDGHVQSVNVLKGAGNRVLDQAAISAVKESSPFPRPPSNLFKGSIHLEITIIFEIT